MTKWHLLAVLIGMLAVAAVIGSGRFEAHAHGWLFLGLLAGFGACDARFWKRVAR